MMTRKRLRPSKEQKPPKDLAARFQELKILRMKVAEAEAKIARVAANENDSGAQRVIMRDRRRDLRARKK